MVISWLVNVAKRNMKKKDIFLFNISDQRSKPNTFSSVSRSDSNNDFEMITLQYAQLLKTQTISQKSESK